MGAENSKEDISPSNISNGWRSRINDELKVMYRKTNIVTTMKLKRLEKAGRVVRMFDDITVKCVFLERSD